MIPTETVAQITQDSSKYTPLKIVKENSQIHPTTSSTKIIDQYCLPKDAITGEGREKFVLNKFLDGEGKLKPQDGRIIQRRPRKSTKELEKIAEEIQTSNVIPKNNYVKKSAAPNYLTLKELVKREGLKTWTHEKDILALSGVPQDFTIGIKSGLRINPIYVDNDKKITVAIDFSPLKSRKYNTCESNEGHTRVLDKDRVTLSELIKFMGLYKLTTKSQILALQNVPDDFFVGSTHKSQINSAYMDKDKNLTINVDFSSLKPRKLKQYKTRKQSYTSPNSSGLDNTLEKVDKQEKDEIKSKEGYSNGQAIITELSNIVEALKPILLIEKKDEPKTDVQVEDAEEYKQFHQKVQSLERALEKSQKEYRSLEGTYRILLQSSKHPSTENVSDLGKVVSRAEHENLKKKFDSAVGINADLLTELEQLKYANRHNAPGPIDISKMLSDAEKVILLIQKNAIRYGNLSVTPENNGMVISSLSGTNRIIHYSTIQKDIPDVMPVDDSKAYNSLFGQHRDTVESILNDFLKVKVSCLEPLDKSMARVIYNKEVCLDPRVDAEKLYIAEILFETELGAALISHGTDGTKANPVILRAITNTFKYHRENEFIALMDKYLPDAQNDSNTGSNS